MYARMPFYSPDEAYAENAYWNRKAMLEAKDVPCADCGLRWHPLVMTLDHRKRASKFVSAGEKRFSPSHMLRHDQLAFKNMLNDLDPVCANCHRLREARRDKLLDTARWIKWSKRLIKGALISD